MPLTTDQIRKAAEASDQIINRIYNRIDELLGGGGTGQFFCMEFPARPLNLHQFEYDTSDRTSVVAKPYTVADSEFRLTDDLYALAPVVQGPNGKKLSSTFWSIVNNYVPKLQQLHDFIVDKGSIRDWLLAPVEDMLDGKPFRGSRMELCKRLYTVYLGAKRKWEDDKSARYDASKNDLDSFARWLTASALVRDQELHNLFNDAVVRGYYHEVLTFLGFLNVCSAAEALETVKQNTRASMRRSLDESLDVLPVNLQPNNWFRAAIPNLSPKDLTMAADAILAQYKTKRAELAGLRSYLGQLESRTVTKDDVAKAEADVEKGKAAFQAAETAMVKQYGDNAVNAFKIYLTATSGGLAAGVAALSKGGAGIDAADPIAKKLDLAKEVADGLLAGFKTQQAFLDSGERLAQLRGAYADATAHDYQAEIASTRAKIENLTGDLRFLETMSGGVLAPKNQPAAGEELGTLPAGGAVSVEDGMFSDVLISSSDSDQASTAVGTSSSSQSSWKVGAFFGSVGHQSSRAQAASAVESVALSKEFQIGLRVAKVVIDRGGWFNPGIFEMSREFQRIADSIRASPSSDDAPVTKDSVMKAVYGDQPAQALQDLLTAKSKDPYLLPAFPVAFVVAKDITIRVTDTSDETSLAKAMSESSSSTGGGFLCFSASHASASKSTAESSYHGAHGKYYYIRIPGPQILGWMLQITPRDNSQPYQQLDAATLTQLKKGISSALANPPAEDPAPPASMPPGPPPAG